MQRYLTVLGLAACTACSDPRSPPAPSPASNPWASPNTVALLGDSITYANAEVFPGADRGYFSWANVLLAHRFRGVAYAGRGGDNTDGMLARMDHEVLAARPRIVVVCAGANDLLAFPASVRVTKLLGNLRSIAAKAVAAGAVPVLSTVPPSFSFDDAIGADWMAVNAAIRAREGFPEATVVADMAAAMSGSPPYHPAPELVNGSVHPNALGAGRMGLELARALEPLAVRDEREFLDAANAPENLLGPVADTSFDTLGDGVPPGWTLRNGATANVGRVARTDGRRGGWLQLLLGGRPAAPVELVVEYPAPRFGDWLFAQCDFETDDDWVGPVGRFELVAEVLDASGIVLGRYSDLRFDSWASGADRMNARVGVLRTSRFPIVETAAKLVVGLRWEAGAGTARLGRCELRRADVR